MDTANIEKEQQLDGWLGYRRLLTLSPMEYNPDGTIQLIDPINSKREEMLINCGGGTYTASNGLVFYYDQFYGGRDDFIMPVQTHLNILSTEDMYLYQSERYAKSFFYDFPMENGSYTVSLMFAEIFHDGPDLRIFDIKINGVQVVSGLDIWQAAGQQMNTPYQETHIVNVNSGRLLIEFESVVDFAKISAISVQPVDDGSHIIDTEKVTPEEDGASLPVSTLGSPSTTHLFAGSRTIAVLMAGIGMATMASAYFVAKKIHQNIVYKPVQSFEEAEEIA